jgi:hypothetical protein
METMHLLQSWGVWATALAACDAPLGSRPPATSLRRHAAPAVRATCAPNHTETHIYIKLTTGKAKWPVRQRRATRCSHRQEIGTNLAAAGGAALRATHPLGPRSHHNPLRTCPCTTSKWSGGRALRGCRAAIFVDTDLRGMCKGVLQGSRRNLLQSTATTSSAGSWTSTAPL